MVHNRFEAQLSHSRNTVNDDDEDVKEKFLDSLDWMKLGKRCAGCFKRAPTVDFM